MSEKDNSKSDLEDSVIRYSDNEKEWQVAGGESSVQKISEHVEKHIGKIEVVFHELLSDTVHIDVHHVAPTKDRPFHTLITSGMSDLPMTVPEGSNLNRFMELMITLPKFWQFNNEVAKDENWYWPIRQLKFLARFPHKYDTWLGWGHTMPNGDPAESFATTTQLSGVIILPSVIVSDDFYHLTISDEKVIDFFSVIPLYTEEMDLKLKHGSDELLNRFDKNNINDIVSIDRKNVAKKRFWFF